MNKEQLNYALENDLFANSMMQIDGGIDPIEIIYNLCKHIDNLDKIIFNEN